MALLAESTSHLYMLFALKICHRFVLNIVRTYVLDAYITREHCELVYGEVEDIYLF